MTRALELTGQSFGRLTALQLAEGAARRAWECVCECGVKKVIAQKELTTGDTKSCGCLRSFLVAQKNTTHGLTRTLTYQRWQQMWRRVRNPTGKSSCYVGVSVCRRWKKFENFLADMGECPDGYSLERESNERNYEPNNCSWIPINEQARNTRCTVFVKHKGKKVCLSVAARDVGLDPDVVSDRINKLGWSVKDALCTPKLGIGQKRTKQ